MSLSVEGLVLEDVSKSYGPVRAVVRASARFLPARIAVIEGANGSGKSTLLAIIAGLTRATSGRVLYRGLTTKDIRATLGWLGTESSLYPDLTSRQNIALAARLRGLHPVTAWLEACDRFLVGELADRPVRMLSRGQRQRVALARALAHRPNLILLDEPTAGLDPATVQILIRVIRHERERGALVILVTHEHPLAVEIRDDAYEMSSGRLRSAPSSLAP